MIQRVQSLFLLLAAIVLGVAVAWVGSDSYVFTGIMAIALVISLITIFLYANRKLQIRLIRLTLALDVIAPFGLLLQNGFETWSQHIGIGVLIVAAIVLAYLAIAGVQHDERLVRSADRLR